MLRSLLILLVACAFGVDLCSADDEPVFSGPQPGEQMPGFTIAGVYDELDGKQIDPVERAGEKPLLLVFVHDPLTRPSAAVTRGLAAWADEHKEKLASAVIMLRADQSAAEAYLKRARKPIGWKGLVGASIDGVEGPGAYGLNRNVSLTIIAGRAGEVTANFALVQPSTTDGPKIVREVARLIGEESVTQEQFDRYAYGRRQYRGKDQPAGDDVTIPRPLLAAVIDKQASSEQVAAAVAKVDEYIKDNPARQKALGKIAARVVGSDRFDQYGTPAARDQLEAWAKKYGSKPSSKED
ncbi:hypothetical protein Mal4_19920 [Maioricimonas rarisocia]|uniref:Thioredoxin domain-containing protein n=1 Tax=Maioricimonas rarisocia TaxID=2528026 RepID=A0A517Z5B9_9PLAN|nr:hypothetical protein [Maioricimonas rarisocia]QDU37676.1 hypothetical protein Mal4_19920 [Maioricimonas rarisocia]